MSEPVPSQRPEMALAPWLTHLSMCPMRGGYPTAHPCSCGLDDALASLAAAPEGLSREDEYVVAGAAQTLDGDPPFSEEALLAVGCDLLAIVRRLTKEPK